ncbi:MAG TPA: Lrp/AsnC family transcriptional regulator [Firmicutes bacterium]|jgi:DNA-binding Lrp family transcriptional regulator|nr:Lrp/AsnC family transcriptional regulator [Bacillota bacterium]HOQ24720.1 Lrp/AsnC family transcriptional regulator [Bacillota bacterium]HPT67729.1 Lrp/AsnC family transcriptional regulator [Bacillota bacterium]
MNKELAILELLEEDDRIQPEEIALRLDLSVDEVKQIIDRMEQEKIILRYKALINWEKAGSNGVSALIEVKVLPQRDVGFDTVAERIYRFPEVKAVYLMSGAYDLVVMVEGPSMREVASFVSQKLATLDHVQSTATHFVLKKYKQDGVIFEENETVERLVVSP